MGHIFDHTRLEPYQNSYTSSCTVEERVKTRASKVHALEYEVQEWRLEIKMRSIVSNK